MLMHIMYEKLMKSLAASCSFCAVNSSIPFFELLLQSFTIRDILMFFLSAPTFIMLPIFSWKCSDNNLFPLNARLISYCWAWSSQMLQHVNQSLLLFLNIDHVPIRFRLYLKLRTRRQKYFSNKCVYFNMTRQKAQYWTSSWCLVTKITK